MPGRAEPLRITARLLDGRVATTDLCLPIDGILAWAWIARNRPDLLDASHSGVVGEIFHPPLPLERREAHGGWWWAASFACGRPVREQKAYWHKRLDQAAAERCVDFGGRRGKVDVGAGPFKGYRMPLTVFLVPELVWYVVGDGEEIRRLLGAVTAIGKKPSQGYGRVREWIVEPWPEDLSDLRPIPDPGGDGIWGVRPPYWEPRNQVRVRWCRDARLAANHAAGVAAP